MPKTINSTYVAADKDGAFEFGNIKSTYSATKRYFTKEGKSFLPIMGEFHFSRYDCRFWEEELLKIKANGLDGVAIYVFWNHHEEKRGVFNYEGDNDVNKFLKLCRKHNMAALLRIGPWCHGEVRYGGFPDWLRFEKKRNDFPKYLSYVKRYWTSLCAQVKEFLDGKTVIGIQLENEYTGKLEHIVTLRKIAEEVGFKVPFFTMTAWPTNTPDKRFLPMMGGYPEAPWAQHKKPLGDNFRFKITAGRSESEIGEDLIKKPTKAADFSDYPYSGCEVGSGNQVTAHRRPIISDKDGYGVAFAKFASGMNWLGYYMYHGGRNPRGKLMQESRITLYPNNYPIVDYDFQAPISKNGDVRKSGDRLRLLHLFIKTWDKDIAKTEAVFANEGGMPYISARINGNGGYCFISNYERGIKTDKIPLKLNFTLGGEKLDMPELTVLQDDIFFFPFNTELNGKRFDYITAQPILKTKDNVFYFMKISGSKVTVSSDGVKTEITTQSCEINGTKMIFLDEKQALQLYYLDDKIIFAEGAVYLKDKLVYGQIPCGKNLIVDGIKTKIPEQTPTNGIILRKTSKVVLPHNYYLYSYGKRSYFSLEIDKSLLSKFEDIKIEMAFTGLNLQVFWGKILIDDYFNTDGIYSFSVKYFRELLKKENKLTIKVVAATRSGVGNVYNEINIPTKITDLTIKNIVTTCLVSAK